MPRFLAPCVSNIQAVYLPTVNHSPAHLFLGGIRRIPPITEVLYTRDIDIARGNLNTIFVVPNKGV